MDLLQVFLMIQFKALLKYFSEFFRIIPKTWNNFTYPKRQDFFLNPVSIIKMYTISCGGDT